ERGVRLRRERGHARRHPQAAACGPLHPPGELGDAEDVLLGLAGQADHEVELQAPPSEVGEQARGVEQLLLAVLLLDDVAQALGAGLGREREVVGGGRICWRMRGDSASTRVDGSDTATCSGASSSINDLSTVLTPL